jgi:outer membrane immunogenic protein
MRRILVVLAVTGIFAAGAVSASAADLPAVPAKAPAAYAPEPVAIWNGFYAGANLGYGWAHGEVTGSGLTRSQNMGGVVGGGQIGYNWQWASPLVLGIEADIQGAAQKNDNVLGALTVTNSITYFATVRGRIGYAPGNWMVYATGGLVYGEFRSEATLGGATASLANSRGGLAVGGGLEWMFAPHWSAKLEYLYLDTGSFNSTVFGVPFTGRLNDNVARVGVNYHF